ncbi:MAG: biopolymer transporter ExbD [Pirellulaceae bacterium]
MELPMSSMIDVVFLLLIFFLTTTTFVRSEKEITSAIQYDSQSEKAVTSELEPAVIQINGTSEGIEYRFGSVVTSSIDPVQTFLKDFQHKSEGVFLRIGDGVPFETTAQMISYAKRVGFQQVTYVPENE